ncbi:MAG: DNA adenine methylase [Lachnospira sp.]|nr:DNA adenine methylase [Lachnospira sp.]
MSLAEKLDLYSKEYWDFRNSKNEGIHKIANYPAPMVAPMQHELLQLLVNENPNYHNMLDPFHGTGVTLVEGQEIGLEVFGIDINPYAHIISLAKLEKYNPDEIKQANTNMLNRIELLKNDGSYERYSFDNISKWFRDDVIESLSIIRAAIEQEQNRKNRRYYWLCFGEIVKKYSNTRTSTFKLHVKEAEKIEEMENHIYRDFKKKIEETYILIGYPPVGKFELKCGDSNSIMTELEKESFDIICTSPPYGDNGTTVTYGQFSTLQLLWIDSNDFKYDNSCIDNYSKIDSLSLGGTLSRNNAFYCSPLLSDYIEKISPHKRKKIMQFYSDYENSFRSMVRLLKINGSMVLTLGNRKVDGIEFPFTQINADIAQHYGLKVEYVITRNILNKRMPRKVSRLSDGQSVSSMSKETTLLLKKES